MLSLSLRSLLRCVSFFRLCSRYFVYFFFFGISSIFLFNGSVSFPCSLHVAGLFVCDSQPLIGAENRSLLWGLGFRLVSDLTSGIVCFWPSVACVCVGCAVWAASVALVELGLRLLRLFVLLLQWRFRVLVTAPCAPSYSSFSLAS